MYGYFMTTQEKLFQKARNNPDGLSFKDFQTLMSKAGWIEKRHKGSHAIWYSPKGFRLPIQNRNGKAKGYQVKQFLELCSKEATQVAEVVSI